MKPAIGSLATTSWHNRLEFRLPVIEVDAIQERLNFFSARIAHHANGVFAYHFAGRMHQGISQIAVRGKNQQAIGVDIETTDIDPAATF